MGPTRFPKMLTNFQSTLRKIPEEPRSNGEAVVVGFVYAKVGCESVPLAMKVQHAKWKK
jgi:hypothetical protein